MGPMNFIIDVHSHIGQFTSAAMTADGKQLCQMSQQAGVTHVVTFSIEACYGSLDLGNRHTLAEVARYDMLSAMVVAHPHHPASSAAWIREAASNPKVVGVKLHPVLGAFDILDASVMKLMDEQIGPSGLTVLSHVGNESPNVPIDKYLQLAARYPQTRFIAAHLGIGILGLNDAAANAWKDNPLPNVWFDMGTLRAFCSGAVETLLAAVGPDRICFGTDAPLYRPAPFVTVLATLDVDNETREKIAWRNALAAIPALAGRAGTPVHA
jgi:predicted TIM-barrel fold metal-dependent hydrolase